MYFLRKTNGFRLSVITIILLLLVACGDSNDSQAEDSVDNNSEDETEANAEETTDHEAGNDASNSEQSTDLELSSLFPDDLPIPDEPELVEKSTPEEEKGDEEALLIVNTPMSLDELKELYEPYYNQDKYVDDLKVQDIDHEDEDDPFDLLIYLVSNDDFRLITSISSREENDYSEVKLIYGHK